MADFIAIWGVPILILLLFLGAVATLSRRRVSRYDQHIAQVKAINDEILAINREILVINRESIAISRESIAINRESIAELREIKQILKDQK